MPADPHPLEPPGEDPFDLPPGLACFVALCTWLRRRAIAPSVSTARRVLAMSLK